MTDRQAFINMLWSLHFMQLFDKKQVGIHMKFKDKFLKYLPMYIV